MAYKKITPVSYLKNRDTATNGAVAGAQKASMKTSKAKITFHNEAKKPTIQPVQYGGSKQRIRQALNGRVPESRESLRNAIKKSR